MSVTITFDNSHLLQIIAKAEQLKEQLHSAVKAAAIEERATKTYRNRTGRMYRNTKGRYKSRSRTSVAVELVIDVPYAGYVVGRGFSNVEQIAEETRLALNQLLKDVIK
jgi:hypothetical protein